MALGRLLMKAAIISFLLLSPKNKLDYSPLQDLENAILIFARRASLLLLTLVFADRASSDYLDPGQQAKFGPIPNPDDPVVALELVGPGPRFLLSMHTALVEHNGPAFFKAVTDVNSMLREIKYPVQEDGNLLHPNSIEAVMNLWQHTGIPLQVVHHVLEESYLRCILLYGADLRRYRPWSNEVYGELLPSLVDEIIHLTNLKKHSLFLDLGSGIGHVVMQACLQTGCRGHGIEISSSVAAIARWMAAIFRQRCHMWGLKFGLFELEEGDMTTSSLVLDKLRDADVILVNNKSFDDTCEFSFARYHSGIDVSCSEWKDSPPLHESEGSRACRIAPPPFDLA